MSMADVSYVPGALTAVAGDQCWALVEASPDSPAVTRIWRQLGQGAAADALLAGLLADGIGGTAGFTLLVAEAGGQHRLFCRGTVGATVVTAPVDGGAPPGEGRATAERINGAGLLTWREQVVDSAGRIFLGEPPADSALRLPATSGVLLAGCMVIDLTKFAARDTVSYASENSSASETPRKKTIVIFPDTITMTHPGSLAGQASAALADGQRLPDDRGPVVPPGPPMPFAAGSAGPAGSPSGPGRPDVPGSGAFPASAMPSVAGPGGPSGGPVPAGVPGGPGGAGGPGPADLRAGDDAEHDFPWGDPAQTVVDAPVRPVREGDLVPPGPFSPGGAPVPGGYPGTGGQSPDQYLPGQYQPAQYQGAPPTAAQPWPPLSDQAWSGGPRPAAPMAGPVPPPPVPARAPGPPGGGMPPNGMPPGLAGGLIDAPPWLSAPPGPAPAGAGPAGAGRAEPPYQPPAPRGESGPGESGSTVKRGELPELAARTTPPDRIGPVVPALLCPSGHVNPPSGAVCRRCGAPLPHDPVPVPRPVLGVLRLSLGDVITLDRGVLMGRNPRTDFAGTQGEERPHVVKLPSAGGDISRTHLRVTLDGWHVLVTDLNSTNGTLVTLPGRDPQQLRPGEPVPIQPGTVVTLADGIDFRYEVTD
jgi:hypothetical protein